MTTRPAFRVSASAFLSRPPRSLAMVFKPFKPPLIRKPESKTEPTDDPEHLSKKPRLSKDVPATNHETQPASTLGGRKPLHQVKNGKKTTVKPASDPQFVGDERFFNALWYAMGPSPYHKEVVSDNSICPLGESQPPKRTKHGMAMVFS